MLKTSTPNPPDSTHRDRRGHLWRSRWAVIGAALAVTLGAGGLVGFANAGSSPQSDIVSITPVRILDTRDPNNVGLNGPFVSQAYQDLKVTGPVQTSTGLQLVVPGGATSVVLNVTTVGSTADGFISVRPADGAGSADDLEPELHCGRDHPERRDRPVADDGTRRGRDRDHLRRLRCRWADHRRPGRRDGLHGGGADRLPADLVRRGRSGRQPGAVDADAGSVQPLPAMPFVGQYVVTFDTNISACAYSATVGRPGTNVNPPVGFAMVANWVGSPNDSVIVFVKDQDGNGAQRGFHLTVVC